MGEEEPCTYISYSCLSPLKQAITKHVAYAHMYIRTYTYQLNFIFDSCYIMYIDIHNYEIRMMYIDAFLDKHNFLKYYKLSMYVKLFQVSMRYKLKTYRLSSSTHTYIFRTYICTCRCVPWAELSHGSSSDEELFLVHWLRHIILLSPPDIIRSCGSKPENPTVKLAAKLTISYSPTHQLLLQTPPHPVLTTDTFYAILPLRWVKEYFPTSLTPTSAQYHKISAHCVSKCASTSSTVRGYHFLVYFLPDYCYVDFAELWNKIWFRHIPIPERLNNVKLLEMNLGKLRTYLTTAILSA